MVKDEYKAGRSVNDVDIVFNDENMNIRFVQAISKVQFTIKREFITNKNDFVVILHDESSNGTFVNEKLVGKGERVVLTHNDTISFAKPEFKGE